MVKGLKVTKWVDVGGPSCGDQQKHAFTMMRDEHVHDDLTARFEKLRGRIRVLSTCSPPREPTAQATASLTAVIHPCAVKLAVSIRIM